MKDNDVIKALECCVTTGASCKDCPAFTKVDRSNCKKFFKGAIDLINRQKAEIEKLKDFGKEGFINFLGNCLVYSKNLKDYNDMRKGLKAEARKDFAERLKEKAEKTTWISSGEFVVKDYKISREELDNLLEEMERKEDEGK